MAYGVLCSVYDIYHDRVMNEREFIYMNRIMGNKLKSTVEWKGNFQVAV